MEVDWREFTWGQIQQIYRPREIRQTENGYIIFPFNRAEGLVPFELPKVLPIDDQGYLIDPTAAIVDSEHRLCHELHAICMTPIYVHTGHLVNYESSTYPYGLRLEKFETADAARLEIHYSNPPAWGSRHHSLDFQSYGVEVLLHDTWFLNGIHWIDFWLINIDNRLRDFRHYCASIQNQRAPKPNDGLVGLKQS